MLCECFFFKQKTAYELRISDWSSDVCSSDLSVMAAGRRWAQGHDAERQLSFTDSVEHADGQDILLSTGALQYLDYTLPELLQRLRRKPRHVLVNLTPMHPDRSFFTLQNLSIA